MKKCKNNKKQKGVILYITLLILSAMLVMSVTVTSLIIGEFKIAGNLKKSMDAVNSAGSGLEITLYKTRVEESLGTGSTDCNTLGLTSLTCVVDVDINFTAQEPCLPAMDPYGCTQIKATGTVSGLNRKLQATYSNR